MKDTKEIKYPITVTMAQNNPGYWAIFKHAFEQQAALWILNKWRAKKHKDSKSEVKSKSSSVFKHQFIYEYSGTEKVREHARQIKTKKWTDLDFTDPHFEANLYKALRFELINTTELVTALDLYWIRQEFRDTETNVPAKIIMHDFSTAGPWPYNKKGSYTSDENITEFKKALTSLPKNECCYFSVPFSEYRQLYFIFLKLKFLTISEGEEDYLDHDLILLLKKTIGKYITDESQTHPKKEWLTAIEEKFSKQKKIEI